MSRETIRVVNPIAPVQMEEVRDPRPRPEQLKGKVVGLLDTRKPNSDAFMDRLEERLRAGGYGVAEFVRRRKPSLANEGTPAATIAELAERCHLVINGVGD